MMDQKQKFSEKTVHLYKQTLSTMLETLEKQKKEINEKNNVIELLLFIIAAQIGILFYLLIN